MKKEHLFILLLVTAYSCINVNKKPFMYLGADLSYVNELMDCEGKFYNMGNPVEPFAFFADKGANLIRLRLWHTPDWTNYSSFNDVCKSIEKAKKNKVKVLLDFHYSDDWADPGKQLIPKAWKSCSSIELLGDSVYKYTYSVLEKLNNRNLLPDIVQIGNETNSEILMNNAVTKGDTINWQRNIFLINKGIAAVRDFSRLTQIPIETMIHIAQPENALWWVPLAEKNGISDFDWIGLSYYPKWSTFQLEEVKIAIDSLRMKFSKRIMIVETAYPQTLANIDSANNLLGKDALIEGLTATPEGQREYMIQLTKTVLDGGGEGVIYWEPAWISTKCATRWGQGSHWENATFFDVKSNEALVAFDFFNPDNYK